MQSGRLVMGRKAIAFYAGAYAGLWRVFRGNLPAETVGVLLGYSYSAPGCDWIVIERAEAVKVAPASMQLALDTADLEALDSLARTICYGRQGRFNDRDYEMQLNRASSLSLVINAMVVWNTLYLERASDQLTQPDQAVPEDAWSHLTPLLWEHVHLVGRYSFEEVNLEGGWRPLRRSGRDV